MTRYQIPLNHGDIAVLAGLVDTDPVALADELSRHPWKLNDMLRRPEVGDAILVGLGDGDPSPSVLVSAVLFFAAAVHRTAETLTETSWVADWSGPRSRIPVLDVDPLLELADDPTRLVFLAGLLARFAVPVASPVPGGSTDIDELVRWLNAIDASAMTGSERVRLLRLLGDCALFQAGVFPDRIGDRNLDSRRAALLGKSLGLDVDDVLALFDPASPSPGLDTLETFGSRWYHAAADADHDSPRVLLDIAARIRPARRFLNQLADEYLHPATTGWAFS